jgi:hypothetical protein
MLYFVRHITEVTAAAPGPKAAKAQELTHEAIGRGYVSREMRNLLT